ncbi:hypothetical protein M2451_000733 [Dysgonomonas sp. PFB1-18]|uniref:hypothetical protein n=1 Tax=unclassified Dysgonomonas TaxID=2630389 RepID=UPI002472EC2C|nr:MULTISPECIES: hypothetical protein [unclassified Dysgonomonas]MDH6308422.1 hypothetical protein [Dysgonomonas sp. PF1-14]MDH6337923.1 hypothetical protein [Dysgonomonas sp. PF1-16]MDH6379420.1 hypothetical protein [Dysgonomonas sp. PFB1-18]MDH6396751.1 hypothetical protein [Dysgonomonas sp. PF1-23]
MRNKPLLIYLLFVLTGFYGCSDFKMPELRQENKPSGFIDKKWKDGETYRIFYIGENTKHVELNTNFMSNEGRNSELHGTDWYKDSDSTVYNWYISKEIRAFDTDNSNTKLRIDTTQIVGGADAYFVSDSTSRLGGYYDYHYYNAYPVAIVNTSKDTIGIPAHYISSVPLVMEALTENNEWKAIQTLAELRLDSTAYSSRRILLPPKNILVSAAYIYQGEYRTKLRICLVYRQTRIYSQEFEGNIKRTQFLRGSYDDKPSQNQDADY